MNFQDGLNLAKRDYIKHIIGQMANDVEQSSKEYVQDFEGLWFNLFNSMEPNVFYSLLLHWGIDAEKAGSYYHSVRSTNIKGKIKPGQFASYFLSDTINESSSTASSYEMEPIGTVDDVKAICNELAQSHQIKIKWSKRPKNKLSFLDSNGKVEKFCFYKLIEDAKQGHLTPSVSDSEPTQEDAVCHIKQGIKQAQKDFAMIYIADILDSIERDERIHCDDIHATWSFYSLNNRYPKPFYSHWGFTEKEIANYHIEHNNWSHDSMSLHQFLSFNCNLGKAIGLHYGSYIDDKNELIQICKKLADDFDVNLRVTGVRKLKAVLLDKNNRKIKWSWNDYLKQIKE